MFVKNGKFSTKCIEKYDTSAENFLICLLITATSYEI